MFSHLHLQLPYAELTVLGRTAAFEHRSKPRRNDLRDLLVGVDGANGGCCDSVWMGTIRRLRGRDGVLVVGPILGESSEEGGLVDARRGRKCRRCEGYIEKVDMRFIGMGCAITGNSFFERSAFVAA